MESLLEVHIQSLREEHRLRVFDHRVLRIIWAEEG
jgi:hypothetical protein